MKLTLITPYRNRLAHLKTQLDWWEQYPEKSEIEWFVVEVTAQPSAQLQDLLRPHGIHYLHCPCAGPFHKTKGLNLALHQAQGQWIAALDVDLIPLGETLARHCWLAARSPHLLVTGYRVMGTTETVNMQTLESAIATATIGPEDQPSALRKHLLQGERFGVMPLLRRDRLLEIGGWDEVFVGWGAEDQDLIERYLLPEQGFCRSSELVYLHLAHGPAPDWNAETLTAKNRAYYYRKR